MLLAKSDAAVVAFGVLILIIIYIVPMVITAAKGKWWFFGLGFIGPLLWWIGAARLAKPGSRWYASYGAVEKARADVRFGQAGPDVIVSADRSVVLDHSCPVCGQAVENEDELKAHAARYH